MNTRSSAPRTAAGPAAVKEAATDTAASKRAESATAGSDVSSIKAWRTKQVSKNSLTMGVPRRAHPFQSMWRKGSPGRYSRSVANSSSPEVEAAWLRPPGLSRSAPVQAVQLTA